MQLKLFKDARYFQILFQSVFLTYGIFYLNWDADWRLYITYFGTSIVTQLGFEWVMGKKEFDYWKRISFSLPSVIISSFGLSLLLKTNHLEVAAMAAFISIASKFILKFHGKHIFNPSALGIVAAIWLTEKAWFSPGQWGSGTVLFFGICCLGCIVVTRVQKLDTSLAFLGSFAGLLFLRQIVYLGWPMDFFIQSISTGSVLLFSFFMITDPKTTPNATSARIVWSVLVGALAFYLTTFKFVNGAPIWVLVFMQPLVPILDVLFKSTAFEWKPKPTTAMNKQETGFLNTVYNNLSI